MREPDGKRLAIVYGGGHQQLPTFVKAHVDGLPCSTTLVHGLLPGIDGRPLLSQLWISRAVRKAGRIVRRRDWGWEITRGYLEAFRRINPSAVLAEWGTVAVGVMEACRVRRLPLIAHFHGYDAAIHAVVEENLDKYRVLFRQAAAVIAVSRVMEQRLLSWGAPAERVHYNPYGVDCSRFGGARPAEAPPILLAVGRMVEKKAPYLTILAFATVCRNSPGAELRMIGDGPLTGVCRDLARGLGVEHAVSFMGAQSSEVIQGEMRGARCFVQHSVEASDGDSEGTPVAVIEAGASGLPVVSTRHAGIPDVVADGETGFLVDERDVAAMAASMLRLVQEPSLAGRMGQAARSRINAEFSLERRIGALWRIISDAMTRDQGRACRQAVAVDS
jgi:glycosyltransferase involved in cell wall biosynthesis